MIIMALLFIIQMSVSIGAVAVTHEQQSNLMEASWRRMHNDLKSQIQTAKDCCGFKNKTLTPSEKMGHPGCDSVSRINILSSIYQTRETVFHRDIKTPRIELKNDAQQLFLRKFEVFG